MTFLAMHFYVFEDAPKVGLMLFVFALLAGVGLFAGERWGWRASIIAIPIVIATLAFANQYKSVRSETWNDFARVVYSLAGGFSLAMIAIVTGIWLHRKRLHG